MYQILNELDNDLNSIFKAENYKKIMFEVFCSKKNYFKVNNNLAIIYMIEKEIADNIY